ncbi:MAG: hypothetical protein ACKVZJ_15320 [Phycisphaerales bacterium]
MRTILSKLIGIAAALGCTLGASAQPLPNPVPLPFPSFKWDQRYTPPRATFVSKVQTCTSPAPFPLVGIDDWLCTKPGPILRIDWWGWLWNPAQAQRPFYIAIYRQDPNNQCRPFPQPVYQACVTPDKIKRVAQNCETTAAGGAGLPIYFLSAKLPNPFFQDGTPTAPQHYFVQISEIDAQSIRPQLDDFKWAGRRPIQVCNAMQRNAGGAFIQPLIDACDQQPDDLSFRLRSRGITGTLTPSTSINGAVTFSLYPPTATSTDRPMESLSLNFTKIEFGAAPFPGENTFSIDFDAPDGTYLLEVQAPGALPRRVPIVLQEGSETQIPAFFDVFFGDLDANGAINTQDLTMFLANFGRTSN